METGSASRPLERRSIYAPPVAVLTPLSLGDARRIGALFGLDVAAVSGILAGSVNSNYALALTNGSRAFLRVYEEQTCDAAAREAQRLEHLAARGVPTPRPLGRHDGGFLAEHAAKPVALFPWVDGEILCQARITPERARRVGEALARMHVAGADLTCEPTERFGPQALLARLDALPPAARQGAVGDAIPLLRARLEARLATPPALPTGLVHGDLFRDNVLWHGDAIAALLDFESASRGAYAFDVAVTLLSWCFGDRLELALARAMVEGYRSVRPPTEAEREGLFAEAVFAATRFSVTRITDFELRPRGTGVYKDFRRFLARLAAVQALGPAGLRDALGLDA